ncbi:MAG TPA: cupin domain-containing protein [Verrucomicrobiae bacterium]|nr:cupin domain-containing protein [Verrucomicrobiae bacterium]
MITQRDIAVAAVVVCATIAAVVLADSPSKPVMHSSVFEWDSLKTEPKPHGARREVFDSRVATLDRLECHVTTLYPGAAPHAEHKHPEEELIIIKEGTLEVVQNNTTNRAEAGAVIFEASSEVHGLRNVGQTTATYYVVKWFSPGTLKDKTD